MVELAKAGGRSRAAQEVEFGPEVAALRLIGRLHLGGLGPDGGEGLAQAVGARSVADRLTEVTFDITQGQKGPQAKTIVRG
ncbi:hypothetical protein [Streptomyces sp. NPDC059262]|uniref:hypothetical protein n=1 Tax=Streptomyces sp. NPDC059262 TaxID=3346797 RepID=UPI00368CB485